MKIRIVVGVLLTVLALLLVSFLPAVPFVVLLTAIVLFAGWEWSILLGCGHSILCRMGYLIFIALLMGITWHLPILWVLYVALTWWIIAAIFIVAYPKLSFIWSKGIIVRGLMGALTLIPCWVAINTIRVAQDGISTLIFMLFLVWASDTGAFIAGKIWGAHKILPAVSPNKTWEGFYGGIVLSLLIAFLGCLLLKISPVYWVKVLLLSGLLSLFSMVGDLFESMLKRQVKVKDVGQFLPGHGGLLDRMDSLTAATPIFLLGLLLLGFQGFF